ARQPGLYPAFTFTGSSVSGGTARRAPGPRRRLMRGALGMQLFRACGLRAGHRSRRQTRAAGAGERRSQGPALVINPCGKGKDRVKDFVIAFTSSPRLASERPVI